MQKITKFLGKYKNYIFICLIVLLALKVFIPQLEGLQDSIAALKDANLYWIFLGIVVFFLGSPVLALQFMALALKPLKFGLTCRVEFAGLFVSKLLPISLGSISLNMYYLIKKSHTASQALAVMTMNALASSVAYCFLIIIALAFSSLSLGGLEGSVNIPENLIFFIILLFVGALAVVLRSKSLRAKINAGLSDLKKNFATYKHRPKALVVGLICNFAGSFTSLFALYASAHAIGVDLSLAGALLAYTFGNIAAALVPTPGGIGSTEAGIYAGLVLVGIDGPDAIIITLLFRLISYWLPILPGYYYFWTLRKSLLSDYSVKKKAATA